MEEAIKKSAVLIEALPYIKKFFKKKIVIKFGGNSLDDEKVRKSVLEDIVFMNFAGMNPVLIHGGGPHINAKLKQQGREYKFVNGLRVTDEETIKTVDEALGEVNYTLVNELKSLGTEAFGLSGKENKLLIAKKLQCEIDLGFVGNIQSVDTTVLDRLVETNMIPVISPVAIGADGFIYNINADEAAAHIAVAIKAEKLILLTNVAGVMKMGVDSDRLFHSLSLNDTRYLMEKGLIAGGMIPKAVACLKALEGKVKKSHIVSAQLPHALLLEIFTDKGIGTEIVKLGRRTKATEGV